MHIQKNGELAFKYDDDDDDDDDDDLVFYVPFNIIKSYRDVGRMIMKGSVQWSAVQSWAELKPGISRSKVGSGTRTLLYILV